MERQYIIPLRKGWLKVPSYRRTGRAVRDVKAFLAKHMKVEDVKIGKNLNMALWTNGSRNPPHKIEVIVKRFDSKEGSYVRAELPGKKFEEEEKKVVEKKSKLQEKIEGMTGQKDVKVSEKRGKKKEEEIKEEVLKKGVEVEKEKVKETKKDEKKEDQEKRREENLIKRADKKEAIKK